MLIEGLIYQVCLLYTSKNSKETKALSEELAKLKEEYAKSEKAIERSNSKLIDATRCV